MTSSPVNPHSRRRPFPFAAWGDHFIFHIPSLPFFISSPPLRYPTITLTTAIQPLRFLLFFKPCLSHHTPLPAPSTYKFIASAFSITPALFPWIKITSSSFRQNINPRLPSVLLVTPPAISHSSLSPSLFSTSSNLLPSHSTFYITSICRVISQISHFSFQRKRSGEGENEERRCGWGSRMVSPRSLPPSLLFLLPLLAAFLLLLNSFVPEFCFPSTTHMCGRAHTIFFLWSFFKIEIFAIPTKYSGSVSNGLIPPPTSYSFIFSQKISPTQKFALYAGPGRVPTSFLFWLESGAAVPFPTVPAPDLSKRSPLIHHRLVSSPPEPVFSTVVQ